ncbi:MAG TPA: hypothetical protein VGN37_19270 [Actinocatenispora sp.]
MSRSRPNIFVLVWLIILGVFTLISGVIGAYQARTYASGERVTAVVSYCESHDEYSQGGRHTKTTCEGRWTTADGHRHEGTIPNASSSDEGRTAHLRALDGHVVSDNAFGAMWPFLLTIGGLGGIVLVLVIMRKVRRYQARVAAGTARPLDAPSSDPAR